VDVTAAGAVSVVVLLMRDRRKPPEQQEMAYLLSVRRQLPQGWTVVDHPQLGWIATDGEEYMTSSDVRALITMRR
jgi:hypothetical protein